MGWYFRLGCWINAVKASVVLGIIMRLGLGFALSSHVLIELLMKLWGETEQCRIDLLSNTEITARDIEGKHKKKGKNYRET